MIYSKLFDTKMNENALEISGLVKNYGKYNVIPKMDLTIKKGDFFALLGPNGAGKSTLINILSSCITFDSGVVKVYGIDLSKDNNLVKQKMGVVPQEINLDPFFNVEEMLDFYAGFFGLKKSQRRTNEIIQAIGLEDKRKANVRMLSGGMKRRLLIGKALVQDPEFIILDEPTAGVDIELRQRLWEYIKKLNHEYNKTIMLTTHYLEEAEALCNSIAIINKGQILYNGAKDDLHKKYNKKSITVCTNASDGVLSNIIKDDTLIISGGNVIIDFNNNKDFALNNALKLLASNNVSVVDIKVKEITLEDIFTNILRNE